MSNKFEVKDIPARKTLTVRTRSPVQNLPQVLGEAYGSIMAYLGELGETPTGMPFVIYYNLDMQDLDLGIGFPVAKKLSGKDNMKASEIAAGKYATTVHVGPYDTMEPTYDALNKWIEDNGHEIEGPAIEFYINDPREVGPENTQTEIQFPLK